MTERSLWWSDGVGHGGPYSQDELRLLQQALAGGDDGVLQGQRNDYAVSINGSQLRTASGRALVNGTLAESDANVDKTPSTPSVGTTGLRIVLRKSWSARTVTVELLEASDGTATPPAVTQTDGTTWEISLATAEITTGGTLQNLVDTRSFIRLVGAWEHIDTQVLDAAAASVSFQSIDSDFRVFRVTVYTRVNGTANVHVRLNNDSSGNYTYQQLTADTTSVAAASNSAQNQFVVLGHSNSGADEPGYVTIEIAKQSADLEAMLIATGGLTIGTGELRLTSGPWNNTADLIDRIDVLLSSGNFEAGSRFTLEGCRTTT